MTAKEVELANKKLLELNKLKDDFLSVTTHELKTPLIPIKSQSQLLLAGDYGKLNKEQTDAIEMIYRNEENLNKLSSEVLDIARIKSDRVKMSLQNIALAGIITNAVKGVAELYKQRRISLSVLPIPKLPKMFIDKLRLEQVMRNLLDNALKFTPEGGRVSVEILKIKNTVTVKITDNGIGINSKNLKKIFVPFFQIDSSLSRKYRGSGLGLAISKGLIEAHGGRIWAESGGDGKGSTFSFNLPINII